MTDGGISISAHPFAWQKGTIVALGQKPGLGRMGAARRLVERIESSIDLTRAVPNPWGVGTAEERRSIEQATGMRFDRELRETVVLQRDEIEVLADALREHENVGTLHDVLVLGHLLDACRQALRG